MIIGLAGPAGVGKNVVAGILASDFGYTEGSFAAPIKEAIRAIFGWTYEHTDGKLKDTIDPAYGISPREAMQHLGTEWGQHDLCKHYPKFKATTGRALWVKRAMMDVDADDRFDWVFSDLRFAHEAEAIIDRGGEVWRVDGPRRRNVPAHESEQGIPDTLIDRVIHNPGNSIEVLRRGVLQALREVQG